RTAFFFSSRRRHTRFSRDWSSDVCSSDLEHVVAVRREDRVEAPRSGPARGRALLQPRAPDEAPGARRARRRPRGGRRADAKLWEIGRASCREREYVAGVRRAAREQDKREE